jgi:DNA-binding MarR family transcriptional regulator
LAEKACILKPSLTGITNRLIDVGLIHRRRSEEDQRFYFISLSHQGEKIFSSAIARMEQCHRIIEEKMGEEKMAALFELLKDIQNLK